jgi:hypothetical protein
MVTLATSVMFLLFTFMHMLVWIILGRLLHTHLTPPHEVCNIPDQAAYITLSPKIGASSVTKHLVCLRV